MEFNYIILIIEISIKYLYQLFKNSSVVTNTSETDAQPQTFLWSLQSTEGKCHTIHQNTFTSCLAITYLQRKNEKGFMSEVITKHTFQINKSSWKDLDFENSVCCHQMMKKAAAFESCLHHTNWPQLQVGSLCIFFLTPLSAHLST